MEFSSGLHEGILLRRYKRFFADIQVGNEVVVAHVPNTGSLKGAISPNCSCLFTRSEDPGRKLKATLQFVKAATSWVGVNTSLTNTLVHEAWREKRVPHWQRFDQCQTEVKLSPETRLDFMFSTDGEAAKHYVEVKNVSMAEEGVAMFPDATSMRGQKHLQELMALRESGHGAEIVFVVQREDCSRFCPADAIDPKYGQLLRQARSAGVSIHVYPCRITPQLVEIVPRSLGLEGWD